MVEFAPDRVAAVQTRAINRALREARIPALVRTDSATGRSHVRTFSDRGFQLALVLLARRGWMAQCHITMRPERD